MSARQRTSFSGFGNTRNEVVPSFTKKHHCHLLVYYEDHQDIRRAMQRERNVKHWVREWKDALIEGNNPEWDDLYPLIVHS